LHPGGYFYNGPCGEALLKRDTFFRLQIYERLWISLVEVYKTVGRSAFPSVCKKDFKKDKRRIYGGEKLKKISWFCEAKF